MRKRETTGSSTRALCIMLLALVNLGAVGLSAGLWVDAGDVGGAPAGPLAALRQLLRHDEWTRLIEAGDALSARGATSRVAAYPASRASGPGKGTADHRAATPALRRAGLRRARLEANRISVRRRNPVWCTRPAQVIWCRPLCCSGLMH